jgi:hypothetical protein
MPVNWWNVSGLFLDIIGVLAVAFIPTWAVNTGRGTMLIGGATPELEGSASILDRLSWGAIVLGFVLQLVGQFWR